jgi:hypothetical protein
MGDLYVTHLRERHVSKILLDLSNRIERIEKKIYDLKDADYRIFIRLYYFRNTGTNRRDEYEFLIAQQAEIGQKLRSAYSDLRQYRDMLSFM